MPASLTRSRLTIRLPGAYELHLPADGVTIWYVVTLGEAQELITVQHVRVDT